MPTDNWLQANDDIDVQAIMGHIRERLARRDALDQRPAGQDPVAIAKTLWADQFGADPEEMAGATIPIWPSDCDIFNHGYKIEWRLPLIGHIHALIRTVIKWEIDRYLRPSLYKQVQFNRAILRELKNLARENQELRRELDRLRDS